MEIRKDRKEIRTKWIFDIKTYEAGRPIRHKARHVSQGFSQEEVIDYTDGFVPEVCYAILRFFLEISARNNWIRFKLDGKFAFLNSLLNEDINCTQQKGFEVKGSEQLVCRLLKAL